MASQDCLPMQIYGLAWVTPFTNLVDHRKPWFIFSKPSELDLPNLDYNMGLTFFRLDRWPESVEAMENVVSRDPENAHVWCTLTRSYRAMGRLDKSYNAIEKATTLDPENESYWTEYGGLGAYYHKKGQTATAQEIYQGIITVVPSDVNTFQSGNTSIRNRRI